MRIKQLSVVPTAWIADRMRYITLVTDTRHFMQFNKSTFATQNHALCIHDWYLIYSAWHCIIVPCKVHKYN